MQLPPEKHRRPAKTAGAAQNEEMRSHAATVLLKVFYKKLNRAYHGHIAAVAALLSGLHTSADYVKKIDLRGAQAPPAGGQNRPK